MPKLSLNSTLKIVNYSLSLSLGITTGCLLVYKAKAPALPSIAFALATVTIATQLIQCVFLALSALIAKIAIVKTAIDNYRLQNRVAESPGNTEVPGPTEHSSLILPPLYPCAFKLN